MDRSERRARGMLTSRQPQPLSAMEMIHKQPVRWTHERVVACEGGGGPAGHPRIFINTDKPEISVCNYCGLPFVCDGHRENVMTPYTDCGNQGPRAPQEAPRVPCRDILSAVMMATASFGKAAAEAEWLDAPIKMLSLAPGRMESLVHSASIDCVMTPMPRPGCARFAALALPWLRVRHWTE